MHRTDDDTLNAALQLLGEDAPPQLPTDHIDEPAQPAASALPRRPVSIAVAIGVVIALVALGAVALISQSGSGASAIPASTSTSTTPGTSAPPVGAITVEGELLGSIRGTLLEGGAAVAYPGQPVTAPRPHRGDAVAWQWELCDPGCTPIGGATHETQASPPTSKPVNIRVVVQVDLDGAQIRIASASYRAMPWPDVTATLRGGADDPATATIDSPAPSTTNTTISSTVTEPTSAAHPVSSAVPA